jgi:phosphopantothenoylcysteine decarboxylase/phosphopantothenate--cysteine ligase
MQTLAGKKILLGMSGGIAAYKCADLTRRLVERGADVRVVMTEAATAFITPLTMQAVSGNQVATSLLDPEAERSMNHIELAKWCDLILLAPATADLIARVASGLGNDLISTLVLASDSPLAVAPAMNQQMYKNIATQENIATLNRRGASLWGPASGEQACGDVGPGRMLEPMQIVERCEQFFQPKVLQGKRILITAGPTREALDPVRFLSNHSSGKMGFELAHAAKQLGANVTLIAGPVALTTPSGVHRINVESALQMYQHTMEEAPRHDVFISCAAVADYRPTAIAEQKIKKTDDNNQMTIELVKNPDIVASVAAMTAFRPFTVGFAAETQDVARYARGKLINKNLDMICANDVSIEGQGFNSQNNALTLYWRDGEQSLTLASKAKLAYDVIKTIQQQLEQQ